MVMKKGTYKAGWMQMGHPRTIGEPFQTMSSWWGAMSWSSKKQELVTLLTTEAEYVAQIHAAKEAVWLRRLFGEFFPAINKPTDLHSDSQSAIALAIGGHYHAQTKHIDIRYHFICYIIEAGSIKLIYCPTDQQTADTLTKALPSVKAKHFAHAMGLRSD